MSSLSIPSRGNAPRLGGGRIRGDDDESDGRRPTLMLRIPRHGAPLHAFSCGLGRMVACRTGCEPVTPAPPGGRARSNTAPAAPLSLSSRSTSNMSLGSTSSGADQEMSVDESTGSRSSMSSVDESDCSEGAGAGANGDRRKGKKKCRVSFADSHIVIPPMRAHSWSDARSLMPSFGETSFGGTSPFHRGDGEGNPLALPTTPVGAPSTPTADAEGAGAGEEAGAGAGEGAGMGQRSRGHSLPISIPAHSGSDAYAMPSPFNRFPFELGTPIAESPPMVSTDSLESSEYAGSEDSPPSPMSPLKRKRDLDIEGFGAGLSLEDSCDADIESGVGEESIDV